MAFQANSATLRLGYSITWSLINTPVFVNKALRINMILNVFLKGFLHYLNVKLVNWFISSEKSYLKLGIIATYTIFDHSLRKKRNRKSKAFGIWQHYFFKRPIKELRMLHNFFYEHKKPKFVYLASGVSWANKFRSLFFMLSNKRTKFKFKSTTKLNIEQNLYKEFRGVANIFTKNSFKRNSAKFIINLPLYFQFIQFNYILLSKTMQINRFIKSLSLGKIKNSTFFVISSLFFITLYSYLFKKVDSFFRLSNFIYSGFDRRLLGRPKIKGRKVALVIPPLYRERYKDIANLNEIIKKIPWYFKLNLINKYTYTIGNFDGHSWEVMFSKGFYEKNFYKRIVKKKVAAAFYESFLSEKYLNSPAFRRFKIKERIQLYWKQRRFVKGKQKYKLFNKINKSFTFRKNKNILKYYKKMNRYSIINEKNILLENFQNIFKLLKNKRLKMQKKNKKSLLYIKLVTRLKKKIKLFKRKTLYKLDKLNKVLRSGLKSKITFHSQVAHLHINNQMEKRANNSSLTKLFFLYFNMLIFLKKKFFFLSKLCLDSIKISYKCKKYIYPYMNLRRKINFFQKFRIQRDQQLSIVTPKLNFNFKTSILNLLKKKFFYLKPLFERRYKYLKQIRLLRFKKYLKQKKLLKTLRFKKYLKQKKLEQKFLVKFFFFRKKLISSKIDPFKSLNTWKRILTLYHLNPLLFYKIREYFKLLDINKVAGTPGHKRPFSRLKSKIYWILLFLYRRFNKLISIYFYKPQALAELLSIKKEFVKLWILISKKIDYYSYSFKVAHRFYSIVLSTFHRVVKKKLILFTSFFSHATLKNYKITSELNKANLKRYKREAKILKETHKLYFLFPGLNKEKLLKTEVAQKKLHLKLKKKNLKKKFELFLRTKVPSFIENPYKALFFFRRVYSSYKKTKTSDLNYLYRKKILFFFKSFFSILPRIAIDSSTVKEHILLKKLFGKLPPKVLEGDKTYFYSKNRFSWPTKIESYFHTFQGLVKPLNDTIKFQFKSFIDFFRHKKVRFLEFRFYASFLKIYFKPFRKNDYFKRRLLYKKFISFNLLNKKRALKNKLIEKLFLSFNREYSCVKKNFNQLETHNFSKQKDKYNLVQSLKFENELKAHWKGYVELLLDYLVNPPVKPSLFKRGPITPRFRQRLGYIRSAAKRLWWYRLRFGQSVATMEDTVEDQASFSHIKFKGYDYEASENFLRWIRELYVLKNDLLNKVSVSKMAKKKALFYAYKSFFIRILTKSNQPWNFKFFFYGTKHWRFFWNRNRKKKKLVSFLKRLPYRYFEKRVFKKKPHNATSHLLINAKDPEQAAIGINHMFPRRVLLRLWSRRRRPRRGTFNTVKMAQWMSSKLNRKPKYLTKSFQLLVLYSFARKKFNNFYQIYKKKLNSAFFILKKALSKKNEILFQKSFSLKLLKYLSLQILFFKKNILIMKAVFKLLKTRPLINTFKVFLLYMKLSQLHKVFSTTSYWLYQSKLRGKSSLKLVSNKKKYMGLLRKSPKFLFSEKKIALLKKFKLIFFKFTDFLFYREKVNRLTRKKRFLYLKKKLFKQVYYPSSSVFLAAVYIIKVRSKKQKKNVLFFAALLKSLFRYIVGLKKKRKTFIISKNKNFFYKISKKKWKKWLLEKKRDLWLEVELENFLKRNVRLFFINAVASIAAKVSDKTSLYYQIPKAMAGFVRKHSWRAIILNADMLWTFLIAATYFSSSYLATMISDYIIKRPRHKPIIRLIVTQLNVFLNPLFKNKRHLNGIRVSINGKINGKDRGIKHVIYKSSIPNQGSTSNLLIENKISYSLVQADSWYGSFGIQVWISHV